MSKVKFTVNEELQELVRHPREDLDIELKQWMDPADKNVQAKFAKELLALRNHGGGYLVIGFKDGQLPVPDENRPINLSAFNTDYFNNIVKRYAEPIFHCVTHLVSHPSTGDAFPVVVVPSGANTPVRCKSDSPDGGKNIKIDTYYVRRPGPESAPPQTGSEWDALMQRCMLNRKEELMASLASLLGTSFPMATPPSAIQPFRELRIFSSNAMAKMGELQSQLKDGDPAKFPHGFFAFSARLVGDIREMTSIELLDLLQRTRGLTGWPPLHVFTRPELAPYPTENDIVECWLARDEARDAGHADFWRASPEGFFYLARGYQEDTEEVQQRTQIPIGKGFELTLPAWRLAEFLIRIRELGEAMAPAGFTIQVIVEWHGLRERKLYSYGGRRRFTNEYVSQDSDYRKEFEVSRDEVDAALPGLMAKVINPMLRKFSFFEPPRKFYEEEVGKLRGRVID